MRETWKLNASFYHLIGRFYNDASSIRQTSEVNKQKELEQRLGSVPETELIGKIEESDNSFW